MKMNMNKIMQQSRSAEKAAGRVECHARDGKRRRGMVEVTLDGAKQMISIKIDPQAVSAETWRCCRILIVAAYNEAFRRADEEAAQKVGSLTGTSRSRACPIYLGEGLKGEGEGRSENRCSASPSPLSLPPSLSKTLWIIVAVLPRSAGAVLEELMKLPGIGIKSAHRIAFHLLKAPEPNTVPWWNRFSTFRKDPLLLGLLEFHRCRSLQDLLDPRREDDSICVVENPPL